ncbi:MAG: hypothetical protein FK733_08085 [Asgard group archaeon]|nr:hypothetical protein [Asgard group archaeon]
MSEEIKFEDIREFFFKMPLVYLATTEENQPRVRPMSLINCEDTLWLTSRSYDEKVQHIKNNPKIEFVFVLQNDEFNGMIRACGLATVVDDLPTKEKLSKAIPFFKDYFKNPEDPDYGLIQLEIEEVRVLSKGNRYKFQWT